MHTAPCVFQLFQQFVYCIWRYVFIVNCIKHLKTIIAFVILSIYKQWAVQMHTSDFDNNTAIIFHVLFVWLKKM